MVTHKPLVRVVNFWPASLLTASLALFLARSSGQSIDKKTAFAQPIRLDVCIMIDDFRVMLSKTTKFRQ